MYTIYTFKYGDTLESIADIYNTTVDELKKLNAFDITNIGMGNQIVVPYNRSEMLKTYVVMVGDTLYDIARRNNIDVNTILLLNGLDKNDFLYPGQEIVLPISSGMFYVTHEGDTLEGVIDANGVTVDDMIKQNKNIYLLPDQIIILKN